MKVYQAHWWEESEGQKLSWHGSKREAQKALKEAVKDDTAPSGPSGIESMNIPTTKDGLIKWLNLHFNSDNG